jgi:peptidoglycan lytic transglycosylase
LKRLEPAARGRVIFALRKTHVEGDQQIARKGPSPLKIGAFLLTGANFQTTLCVLPARDVARYRWRCRSVVLQTLRINHSARRKPVPAAIRRGASRFPPHEMTPFSPRKRTSRRYQARRSSESIGELTDMMMRLGAAFCGAVMMLAFLTAANAQSGIASVYAYSHGKTASGEPATPGALTAAHRTLPFGTHVRVTNKRNGRSVVVRINDRGPFIAGRIIDLTPAGARALGFSGLAPVTLELTNG